MKKTTWAIIGLSFFVWVLLIVVGVLFIKYKTTANQLKVDKELEIATTVRDIVRESGQPIFAMGMTHADSDFVLTCGLRQPISDNIKESIGEALAPVIKAFYDRFNDADVRRQVVSD